MKKKRKIIILFSFLFVFFVIFVILFNKNSENNVGNEDYSNVESPTVLEASPNRPIRPVTTIVTLADDNIEIDGNGASSSGSILTISAEGVYEITGTLSDGQIIINAPDSADVELVLSGVNISSNKNAAIYCKNSDEFIITLTENTQNILSDAKVYSFDDKINQEPNATLFSKTDMNIGGDGSLTINANFNHGISSKDDLVIENGVFTINSTGDAIRGKDSLVILNGKFDLTSIGDGIQSSSIDGAKFGYVQIFDGDYTINANGDAIQAETNLFISGGKFNIITDGTLAAESDSQKGLKTGTLLTIDNGTFNIISKDDAIHSDVDVEINGGVFHIETDDDGIHANRNLYINDGEINIPNCYEGFEGTVIEINGGKTFIKSSNDAVNAMAGTPEAETGSRKIRYKKVYVSFNGGELEAVSGGDTVDSNGNIYVTGGTLRLSSPPRPYYEGAFLCSGDVIISGGNVALVGNVGIGLYWEKQPVLFVSYDEEFEEGTVVSLRDQKGNILLDIEAKDSYIQSAFTSDELKIGETYEIYIDDMKKMDVTLDDVITKIGANGGEFTGGFHR